MKINTGIIGFGMEIINGEKTGFMQIVIEDGISPMPRIIIRLTNEEFLKFMSDPIAIKKGSKQRELPLFGDSGKCKYTIY